MLWTGEERCYKSLQSATKPSRFFASSFPDATHSFCYPQVTAGQTAALALKKVKRSGVRKGMVLADEARAPHASWEFDAEIAILTHSTTIQPKYQVSNPPTPS